MTGRAPVGVLVMAHGTPDDPSQIEAFYTRIRRGRPPTAEQLADLVRRYDAIGGTSPLAARTAAQVAGITAALEALEPGGYLVRYGAKHTDPTIESAAAGLAAAGVDRVVGLVLTPHRSSMGSGEYLERAAGALAATRRAPAFVPVRQWHRAPGFPQLLADRLRGALVEVGTPAAATTVLFTAHSLPERVVAEGDPYPSQLAESAADIAGAAGLDDAGVAWEVAWQSAGRTPEPWIGPDILAALRRLATVGVGGAVVCPVGFVADHLEVLFDVDIEARQVAETAGLAFARTASLNDDPRFCAVLASVVSGAAGAGSDGPGPPAAGD